MFKSRTLDLAADRHDVLLDWYLALASLIPNRDELLHKKELLDETALRRRIEFMMTGDRAEVQVGGLL